MVENLWATLCAITRENSSWRSLEWNSSSLSAYVPRIYSCFEVMPNPQLNIKKLIALLAWVTPSDAVEFYGKMKTQQDSILKADREQIKWKAHPLHAENTKHQLEALCRTLQIPVTSSVTKHQMVSLIAHRRGIPEPSSPSLYSGKLIKVTTTTAAISH